MQKRNRDDTLAVIRKEISQLEIRFGDLISEKELTAIQLWAFEWSTYEGKYKNVDPSQMPDLHLLRRLSIYNIVYEDLLHTLLTNPKAEELEITLTPYRNIPRLVQEYYAKPNKMQKKLQ